MTWKKDNDRTVQFFSQQLEQHPSGPGAVNWGSEESQRLRFSILEGGGNWDGCSVLDVGCGCGDLVDYIRERGLKVDYIGCDVTPGMVERAEGRFPGRQFNVRDLMAESPAKLPQYDYVVASGIFYLREVDSHAYVREMASRMFALCRRGVAFNSLSDRADKQDAGEFYAKPEQVFSDCLAITRRVVLRHDYLPNDFTVYLYREDS